MNILFHFQLPLLLLFCRQVSCRPDWLQTPNVTKYDLELLILLTPTPGGLQSVGLIKFIQG